MQLARPACSSRCLAQNWYGKRVPSVYRFPNLYERTGKVSAVGRTVSCECEANLMLHALQPHFLLELSMCMCKSAWYKFNIAQSVLTTMIGLRSCVCAGTLLLLAPGGHLHMCRKQSADCSMLNLVHAVEKQKSVM